MIKVLRVLLLLLLYPLLLLLILSTCDVDNAADNSIAIDKVSATADDITMDMIATRSVSGAIRNTLPNSEFEI